MSKVSADLDLDAPSASQRWAILISVVLAVTLYGMTILIVTVLLPQMQGSLSATRDQIAWVMTFNILATAVVTPMTGWLAARFGRRNVMLGGVGGFAVSTIACGLADSLVPLVLYRIVQGACGAPLVPLGQAIILDSFPKRQHGMATSIFGMGVVIGPAIGPTLGGYLAEEYNWRWAFFMIVPFATAALLGLFVFLSEKGRQADVRLDWTGFLALSTAIVCLQLMLDRGQRQDWFESPEIIVEASVAVIAFYIFVVHSLTAKKPFLNPKLLLDRNYTIGLVIVTVYGMLNFTPMVLLPPMLQNLMGFPDSIIGTVVAARGAGAVIGFFMAMYIGKLDPRIGMAGGFAFQGVSGLMMAGFDFNTTFADVALVSGMQGIAVGVVWVPLTVATFATLSPRYLAESSSVYHLLRNLGSSIFISGSVTLAIVTSRMNYAGLTEHISLYNENLAYATITGGWNIDSVAGLAGISGEIDRQAAMIGYLNAHWAYTLTCFLVVPLVLLVRVKRTSDGR